MMKYLLFIFALLHLTEKTNAQDADPYRPFNIEIGLGVAVQHAQSAGMLLYMEPAYMVNSRFKAGFRLEMMVASMKFIGSDALTMDYYLTRNHARYIFVGGGFGYYNSSSTGGCDPGPTTTHTVSGTNNWGALLRTGIEIQHLRLGIEYNFVPSTYVSAVDANEHTTSTVIYKNSYLGFKAGICIGGGKKRS
jgi:hypothetical protein